MSDDIVARLRACSENAKEQGVGVVVDGLQAAADEIERLRLEMSIPRDEYAMTWKNLLDRIDGLDIVEWIRAYANAYSPSDYSSPIAREVVVRSDKRWLEAADEIERLRAERDEARRWVCQLLASPDSVMHLAKPGNGTKSDFAAEQGWDCFKEATDEP